MTTADLAPLIVAALVKGVVFGALFAWFFPRLNTYITRKMGRDPGPLRQVAFASPIYFAMAALSGSGFALIDLIGMVSDAAGLPELLRWTVVALFAASVAGTVVIGKVMPSQPPAPPA